MKLRVLALLAVEVSGRVALLSSEDGEEYCQKASTAGDFA